MRAKRIILLTIIIGLVFSARISAQTEIFISPALNISSIRYSDDYQKSLVENIRRPKVGWSAGLSVKHDFNPVLAIYSDLAYSRKGQTYLDKTFSKKVKIKANYLNWSASGNGKIIRNRQMNLYFGIGFYTAFWLNGAFTNTSLLSGETQETTIRFNSHDYQYSRWDAGLKGNLIWQKAKSPWLLTINYEYGLLESSKYVADSFKNRLLQICLAYRIL